MYVVTIPTGWVIVSGDKRVMPILAYSDENGIFPTDEEMPLAMSDMLNRYNLQIDSLRHSDLNRVIHPEWDVPLNENCQERSVVIYPLLVRGELIMWKQHGSSVDPDDSIRCFNKFCPPSSCYNHYMPAGCVPVALGSIMWYWEWPYVRKISLTNEIHWYDWSRMPNAIGGGTSMEEVNEIATLLHDIGVALGVNYTCNGSHPADNDDIAPCLQSQFSYTSSGLIKRADYTNSQWLNMIKSDLNDYCPVFYAGYGNFNSNRNSRGLKGHAFVIDGYDSDNHFHIIWGSGTNGSGFYTLDEIVYNINQNMIHNIRPNPTTCLPVTINPANVWPSKFVIQNGGGITIGNRTITSSMQGVILSGDYIRFTSGFKINAGAYLHAEIKDMHCDDDRGGRALGASHEAYHIPGKLDAGDVNIDETSSSATKILRNGQFFIIYNGKTYTATGAVIEECVAQ